MAKTSDDRRRKDRKDCRRILYVIGSLELGGAERHLVLIAPRLRALGWQPTVYCVERKGRQSDILEAAGVDVIGPPSDMPHPRPALAPRALRLALSACKLFGLTVTRRPAIAHFFLPGAYLIGAPLAMLARVPVRVMSRRSLNLYQRGHRFACAMEMRLHGSMTRLLANSRSIAKQLIEDEGADPERVELIYNGVDLSALDAAWPALPVTAPSEKAARPLTLIIVANLIHYKGHADLLQALAQIASRLPPWRLLCVGRDDGCGAELQALASELSLEDQIQFAGERTDVPTLLKAADIGILCSHEEGFANAILEGMAAGLPMVVTDVGGNAEAVVDGETGLVVPARNPQALGAAIATLAKEEALRRRMGAAGRARAETVFSIDACIAQYDRLYQSLLGEATSALNPQQMPLGNKLASDD